MPFSLGSMPLIQQRGRARAIYIHIHTHTYIQQAMVESGCLPPLVACLSSNNVGVQEQYIHTHNTCMLAYIQQAMVESGCLPPLVACLSSNNVGVQEQAAASLRVLSGNSENQARIVEEGGLGGLIDLLKSDNKDVQVRACQCLCMYVCVYVCVRKSSAYCGGGRPWRAD